MGGPNGRACEEVDKPGRGPGLGGLSARNLIQNYFSKDPRRRSFEDEQEEAARTRRARTHEYIEAVAVPRSGRNYEPYTEVLKLTKRSKRLDRQGKAPGLGGQSARNLAQSQEEEDEVTKPVEDFQVSRNLEESHTVETQAAKDRRTVTERVWQHLASVPCMDHEHNDPVIVPQTVATWEPHAEYVPAKEAYQTTGGDIGRFPRGSEFLGRPCVSHSLNTKFSHHLAASGMFRNHSLNT